MDYEVLVVGGGIGGLTVAALLAVRGVRVCLFERADTAGGCAANVSAGGYEFEGGAGLYSSWGEDELHQRIFAELGITPPETRLCTPAYIVRLPDGTNLSLSTDSVEFESNIAQAFPECAANAVAFYQLLASTDAEVRNAAERSPDLRSIVTTRNLLTFRASHVRNLRRLNGQVVSQHLGTTSPRFRQFIDGQLQMLAQSSSDECPFPYAAVALTLPRRGMYAMKGGGTSLAQVLTNSIRKAGGTVRLNSPVLRLAYAADGSVAGVEMLSGETVFARRAVVSNLTAWDTYGKLVGQARIPSEVRLALKSLRSNGAYMLYLGMDEAAAVRLPADHVLAITNSADQIGPPSPFMFSATPEWDVRGPNGKRAVTVWTQTDAETWFTFHNDTEELETQDQETLERWWNTIHHCLPELGSGVEVIETETPQGHYERMRRRLGMVGGFAQSLSNAGANAFGHHTHLRGLYMVGDTIFPGPGLAGVSYSALLIANELAPTA
jgi:C-3',4' desaturase CrtD